MSNIQNRLEELQPYVIGIRYFQGLPVIDVVFKEKWVVRESEMIHKEKGEGEENYYMFFSQQEGVGLDELLNHAEEIINLNLEKEYKNELFKVKINELKKLFQTNPLSKLENMRFLLSEPKITTESAPEEINLDDDEEVDVDINSEIEEEEVIINKNIPPPKPKKTTKKKKAEPVLETVVSTTKVVNNTPIELPPKPSNGKGGKIELEDHSIETDDGPCTHGADSFCPKCMDNQ